MNAFFVWELVDPQCLLDRQWGGDTLVWHRASGDTHLLNNLATQVFRRLKQAPASPAELSRDVPDCPPGAPATHGARSPLEATLQEMARLGLVATRPI